MKKTNDLTNKTVLVLGATGLIGSEIVKEFITLGANVVAIDLDLDSLNSQRNLYKKTKTYLSLEGDITDLNSIQTILSKSQKKFGQIDAAVNLAYPKNKEYGAHFWDVSFKSFSENLSNHLGGYFLFMQQCAKYSLDNDVPLSLVNFSSIYGVIAPKFDIYKNTNMTLPVEYAAIKSAILHLSLYVTSLTKGSQFRVNCISPGGVLDNQAKDFLNNYKALSRTKGMLNPQDIIGTVAFLCSDSSKYICGQNIIVDDGFSS